MFIRTRFPAVLLALLLAVYAVFPVPMTACAQEMTPSPVVEADRTCTLALYKLSEGDHRALSGVVFSYLRVGDVVPDSISTASGAVHTVLYALTDGARTTALLNALALTTEDCAKIILSPEGIRTLYFTSDTFIRAMQNASVHHPVLLKNSVEVLMANHHGIAIDETDLHGYSKAEHLTPGLYLLAETAVPENVADTTLPFFVCLPMPVTEAETGHMGWRYDVTVQPKNVTDTPTLDKQVTEGGASKSWSDAATGSAGDRMEYRILSRLPTITSHSTMLREYTFTDCLQGLTYEPGPVIRFYTGSDCTGLIAEWTLDDGKFTVSYTDEPDGTRQMVLRMTETGLHELNTSRAVYAPGSTLSGYSNCTMVVEYGAVFRTDGFVCGTDGNPNTVELRWTRSNTAYFGTLTDECRVYTFGLSLTKRFSGPLGDFSAVKFILRNVTDGHYLTFRPGPQPGVYYADGTVGDPSDASPMTPDDRGRLRVLGLEADRYELKETDTDLNYLLLHHPIPVEIRLQTGDRVTASAIADGKESALQPDGTAPDALVTLTVVNKPLVPVIPGTPPSTGGTAAVLHVCIGLCIFALFGLMLLGIPPKKDRHTK